MDALARRAGIFDALRHSAVQNTGDRAAVIVVEDLHWVDESSQGCACGNRRRDRLHPILMILTHRPGYKQPLGERGISAGSLWDTWPPRTARRWRARSCKPVPSQQSSKS